MAALTELAPPQVHTYAVGSSQWSQVAETLPLRESDESEPHHRIETWFYAPTGLSNGSTVDCLSLYVQFHDHRDERVAMAADSLLERITW